eukprot:1143533-Pelagomonas_calceolata.AAC.9
MMPMCSQSSAALARPRVRPDASHCCCCCCCCCCSGMLEASDGWAAQPAPTPEVKPRAAAPPEAKKVAPISASTLSATRLPLAACKWPQRGASRAHIQWVCVLAFRICIRASCTMSAAVQRCNLYPGSASMAD